MFVLNVWDEQGISTVECGTLEEALSKASELVSAGNPNVTILDRDKKTYAEADIDLLIKITKAEQKPSKAEMSLETDQNE